MKSMVNVMVTTFVIVFPHFILKNYPYIASSIGIALAVIVNVAGGSGYR